MKYNATAIHVSVILSAILTAAQPAAAGGLLSAYDEALTRNPDQLSQEYRTLAAEQSVIAAQRGYFPRASLNAEYVGIVQDINQAGSDVLRDGRESFNTARVNLEVVQPLVDTTVAPHVRAAKARLEAQQAYQSVGLASDTQSWISRYVLASLQRETLQSLDRVQARLEKEMASVNKGLELKTITKWDAEIVRRNFADIKRSRDMTYHKLQLDIIHLGLEDTLGLGELNQTVPASEFDLEETRKIGDPRALGLRAEITELKETSQMVKRRGLPTVSLVGRYGYNDASGSLFGGSQEISNIEGGILLRWAFDGGQTFHEAQEQHYLMMAKEAELQGLTSKTQREIQDATLSINYMTERLNQTQQVMSHQKELMETAAKAYEAGSQSYTDALEAFMLYESTVRDWQEVRYQYFLNLVEAHATLHGWNRELVEKVDSLLASTK